MPFQAADFESAVSADSTTRARDEPRFFHDVIRYDCVVIPFIVGLVVGASAAVLLMIVIAPSRRVRAEHPLPPDVERDRSRRLPAWWLVWDRGPTTTFPPLT